MGYPGSLFNRIARELGKGMTADAGISISLWGDRQSESASWTTAKGMVSPVDADRETALMKILENLADAPGAPPIQLGIQVLSRADAESFSNH